MPYDHPEPDDPQMLVGIVLPADESATREMAYTFAEEFARRGYTAERLLRLFQNPYYAGAHGAYRALGEAAVRAIIEECVACWGRLRAVDVDRDAEATPPPPCLRTAKPTSTEEG